MKLQYTAVVRDSGDQSDTGVATSQDVVPPPIPPQPGAERFVLDLSKTAFNPATGRNDIVIGGGFRPPGANATQFGSSDIDALIHNGERRVRIHYAGTNDTNRSINLVPKFLAGPGEVIHTKGTWLFEMPSPFYAAMRKWLYYLRSDTESTHVLSTHGGNVANMGSLDLVTDNPDFYAGLGGVKLRKYSVVPAAQTLYGVPLELEYWFRIQTAAFIPDGGVVVKLNGHETFRADTGMLPVKTPKATKGGPVKPLTLWKFGQQAQGEPQSIITDEWRYISDGLLIEKVASLP